MADPKFNIGDEVRVVNFGFLTDHVGPVMDIRKGPYGEVFFYDVLTEGIEEYHTVVEQYLVLNSTPKADFYQIMFHNDTDGYFEPGLYYPTFEEGLAALKKDMEERSKRHGYFTARLEERYFGERRKNDRGEKIVVIVAEQKFNAMTYRNRWYISEARREVFYL